MLERALDAASAEGREEVCEHQRAARAVADSAPAAAGRLRRSLHARRRLSRAPGTRAPHGVAGSTAIKYMARTVVSVSEGSRPARRRSPTEAVTGESSRIRGSGSWARCGRGGGDDGASGSRRYPSPTTTAVAVPSELPARMSARSFRRDSRRLRILMLGPVGGLHVEAMARAVYDRGHEVIVGGPVWPVASDSPTLNHHIPVSVRTWPTARWMRRLFRDTRPDVVHAHWMPIAGLALLYGASPLVVSAWGSDVFRASPLRGSPGGSSRTMPTC